MTSSFLSYLPCSFLFLDFKEVRILGTSERRIETIKYLCRKRRATMAEISKEFGVSVRTVKRDIDYLSGVMMIPIYCQSGKYEGGVYIDDDYRWDKMYMTLEQISLLIKVKEMVTDKLSDKENTTLKQIIDLYSMPQRK
jgi:predicted DNA-binding transcriptional regulator YafY